MADFFERVHSLPILGLGISTEYGAGHTAGSLDPLAMQAEHPNLVRFLEMGIETVKGLDQDAERWLEAGLPCTYHFLDVNLDEPEDLDEPWLAEVNVLAQRMKPAWMCGDAGLWHFGKRERGHMLLLPPILTDEAATRMAEGIMTLRDATGLEIFPENPPGVAFIGDLHLLEFFARVAERADTGLLLDCAHLAIYQRIMGHDALDGLADFPAERVVEIHVAGGSERNTDGFRYVEDDHTTAVLDDTWHILEALAPRAKNLRAAVFECERNGSADVLPGFERIRDTIAHTPAGQAT